MSEILSTARLIVREWTDAPSDLDRMFDIYRRDEVTRWLGRPTPMLRHSETMETVARWRATYAECAGSFGVWAAEVRETGKIAGSVLLKPFPAPTDGSLGLGEVEIGWHFHPDSWGQGYATEAARGVLGHGFGAGLHEIYAIAKPDNEPSLAVMRRLNMTRQGLTKRWYDIVSECYVIRRDDFGGGSETMAG